MGPRLFRKGLVPLKKNVVETAIRKPSTSNSKIFHKPKIYHLHDVCVCVGEQPRSMYSQGGLSRQSAAHAAKVIYLVLHELAVKL